MAAEDDTGLRQTCQSETDMIINAGYSKPISHITISERQGLVNTIALHYTLLRNKAELDQLKAGLSELGVGEAMQSSPKLFEPMFIPSGVMPLPASMCHIN